jgi:hypothetical protein
MLKRIGLSLLLIIVALFLIYLSWGRNTATKICDNLTNASLLISDEYCLISSDFTEYVPEMFPIGVNREYVEKGMQGFYAVGDGKYLLRRTPPSNPYSWMISYQINFSFDSKGILYKIQFDFF